MILERRTGIWRFGPVVGEEIKALMIW